MALFDWFKKNTKGGQRPPDRFDPPSEKVSEMLDEDQYWGIIERSLQHADDLEEQEDFLVRHLLTLTPKEMIGFRLRTDKLLQDTYTSDMWCAAYVIKGGCSDDSFDYFRCWLISRGRVVYEKAKQKPDNLADVIDGDEEDFDFEELSYVALTAFERITGKDLYDYMDYDTTQFGEGGYPAIQFTWQEDNDESMKKICPRLFEKYGN